MQTKEEVLDLFMDELLSFYEILLTTGYSSVPLRHMYWSNDPDVYNGAISHAMRRKHFDDIMTSIHLVDYLKTTDNPIYKVQLIFSALNDSYKMLSYTKVLSVDKSMISYYGNQGCKQFITGKPIQFGYELWSLSSPTGSIGSYYIVHARLPKLAGSSRMDICE